MSTSPKLDDRPLSDRARDWLFRLLFAQSVNQHPPHELVATMRQCFVYSDEQWTALKPQSPYLPDLRDGHINERVWSRIEDRVVEALNNIDANQDLLQQAIRQASPRWRLDRMPRVDRICLVIGAYELLISRAKPARRVINRTVELAKRYGAADSRRFVNGILDQIRKNHRIEPD